MTRSAYTIVATFLIVMSGVVAYKGALGLGQLYRALFPDVSVVKSQYPVAVGKEGNRIIYKFQKERPPHWRSLRQIPRQVVAAVLMSEDGGFFQHHGYEPEAIRAAWEHNHKAGVKVKRGGSTITQQLVKNLFLSPEKTLVRKVRELLLAVEIERKVSKIRILETYLNIAEWGPGIYGIDRASERYFKKPVSDLTAREGAILAFMLPNPNKYQYSIREDGLTAFAAKRVDTILERLWKTGHISDEEYSTAPSAGGSAEIPSSL